MTGKKKAGNGTGAASKNEKPALTIPGLEAKVDQYLAQKDFVKTGTKVLDEMADEFRGVAARQLDMSGSGLTMARLLGSDGRYATVVMPDLASPSARCALTPKILDEAAAGGLDIGEMVETTRTVVLSGSMVVWFDEVVKHFASQGVTMNESEIDDKSVIRLSVEGVAKLRSFAKAGSPAALRLLGDALRAPAVK